MASLTLPPPHEFPLVAPAPDERSARRDLLDQVARLESDLSALFCSAYPRQGFDWKVPSRGGPRMLSLAELEQLRDDLAERLHEVPVHVIPCITPRPDGLPSHLLQASVYGSIIPAAWSFMLATRARGLGSSWTTLHLMHEEEAAALLGIPFAEMAQVGLIPVAYTAGTVFRPAPRAPLDGMVHWDHW